MVLDKNSQAQGNITDEIELAENNNLMYLTLILVIPKLIKLRLNLHKCWQGKQNKK